MEHDINTMINCIGCDNKANRFTSNLLNNKIGPFYTAQVIN